MKLTEISAPGKEPMLIVMLRMLFEKGQKEALAGGNLAANLNRIWFKTIYGKELEVTSIKIAIVDSPAQNGHPAYSGRAYHITMAGGTGIVVTPDEAEDWTLERRFGDVNWDLKKVRK